MANDGLLMNFELGEDPVQLKPTVKGGDWKQRRQIKKRLRDRDKPSDDILKVDGNPIELPPSKRLKTDQNLIIPERHAKAGQPRSREIISSLFSFNPVPKPAPKDGDADPQQDITPSNAPLPEGIDSFLSLGLSETLASHLLTKLTVKDPTAIQNAAIPALLQDDSDAFIQAQTGSGKTLAYLLPLVQKIMRLSNPIQGEQNEKPRINRHSGLFAIILAPTRELAKQISVVLEKLLGCAHWLVAGTVIGGEKKKSEKARLRKGLNILIATPGRLVDHLSHTDVLDVSHVRWLILDEGDRLMELGFEQDIKAVMERLEKSFRAPREPWPAFPTRRTSILCSATMKMNVQRLGEMSLKDAIHIRTDTRNGKEDATRIEHGGDAVQPKFSVPAQLKQSYVLVPPKQRLVTLCALIRQAFARKGSVMKAIVFFSCADSVEFHFMTLTRKDEDADATSSPSPEATAPAQQQQGTMANAPTLASPSNPDLKIFKLHGSLTQGLRTSTLTSFAREATPSILLCTDVASRGLDLPAIDLIIEYDPAFSADDHLHRIGRTARAGRDGRATVFLMPGPEESYVDILQDSYKETPAVKIIRQDAAEVMKRGFNINTSGSQKRDWEEAATEYQLDVERWVLADTTAHEHARKAYISHVRAYATHIVPERHMFDIKDLHLGHLAKAFGLREPPANMGRSKSNAGGKSKRGGSTRRAGRHLGSGEQEDDTTVHREEAKQKMRKAMKTHMNAVSEFNIG